MAYAKLGFKNCSVLCGRVVISIANLMDKVFLLGFTPLEGVDLCLKSAPAFCCGTYFGSFTAVCLAQVTMLAVTPLTAGITCSFLEVYCLGTVLVFLMPVILYCFRYLCLL